MPRHHIIISGTGRAGTTFIVQLLTELGLETGYTSGHYSVDPNCNSGLEHLNLRDPNSPYIIKSPWLCDYLDEVLDEGGVVIDHAIVPMRDLYSAAQSRREVANRADPSIPTESVPGGLWHTKEPRDQEMILTAQLYKLIYALAKYDIPLVLLIFPRFVNDPEYLFLKIRFALGDINYETFFKAFKMISQPKLVHNFTRQNNNSDFRIPKT